MTDKFDEILNEDLEETQNEESQEPDEGGTDDDSVTLEQDDDQEVSDKQPTVDELMAKLQKLEKEKDGLYREMINERKTRQELKSQLDAINSVLAEIKQRKAEGAYGEGEKQPTLKGVPVKFDEDDNPYIDAEDLIKILEPKIRPVNEAVSELAESTLVQQIEAKNAEIMNSLISEDPNYAVAAQRLNQAWAFLDKGFDKVLAQKGIDPSAIGSMDDAIEILENSDLVAEFEEKFPGLDYEVVIDAFTRNANGLISKRKYRKALKMASQIPSEGKEKLDKLKFLSNKPSNLSGKANQKGGGGRTLADVAEISVDDFLNLSDADIARIERALRAGK